MLMKDLVAKIRTELKKVTNESFDGLTAFDYFENKFFLKELENICHDHENSNEEVGFEEKNNPFVRILADRSLLLKRIKEARIHKTNVEVHKILPSEFISQMIVRVLINNDPARHEKNYFLAPDLPLTRPQDNYLDLSKLAKLMLEEIAKIPEDEPTIDTRIYWASKRSVRDLIAFLQTYANAKEPIKITREECAKFLNHTKERWKGIYDTGSQSNPNTQANLAYTLLGNALVLADTYSGLNYVEKNPDKWITHKPVTLKKNDGTIIPPNERHLNYITGLKEYTDINLDSVVEVVSKKHGRAVYNFSKVKELYTPNDLLNRMVLIKLARLYIEDRESHRSLLFTKGDKVPAAKWLIDHLLNKTNLNNFPNEIPKEFVHDFHHGELKKFLPLIAEVAKIALAQEERAVLKLTAS